MLRKVLIVDDNKVNRHLLRKILSGEYEVLEACNGEEALNILKVNYDSIAAVILDIVMPVMDGCEVLASMNGDPRLSGIPVIATSGSTNIELEEKALALGANDFIAKPYNPIIIRHRLWNTINLRETAVIANAAKWDKLTGLYNREAFFSRVSELISLHEPGYYIMSCFDIDNFKIINDQYGTKKGDEILSMIGDIFCSGFEPLGGICCRVMADNFAILYPRSLTDSPAIESIRHNASILDGSIRPITFSIGRYIVDDTSISISSMYDRATMAETSVKGRYDMRIAQYDESMRDHLLHEQRIITEMNNALENGQFKVWLQPQYNHASGALIGAEALVRWHHPSDGTLIPPGDFIPVFERNGFIYELDKYVWCQVCILLRKWLDSGVDPRPISVNISRHDLFHDDFIEVITGYVRQYNIPVDLLRLEVTETAFSQSSGHIIAMVKELIAFGFTVEIDDFGSGYSSLNTLKDVPATVLKLDMQFLENTGDSRRSGNILESIVRMAKWLGMSVIAEGVETKAQADYLKSIGCYFVQGYYYAKPMSIYEYEQLSATSSRDTESCTLETVDTLDNNSFWDPNSMDTLIFNSYVGGACIFEYHDGQTELLRVNDKYLLELGGGSVGDEEILNITLSDHMDSESMSELLANIRRAIDTNCESACELRLTGVPGSSGPTYIRSAVRVIARAGSRFLLYCSVINTTAQRMAEQKARETSAQLTSILRNANGGVTAVTFNKDQTPKIVFANHRYYSMFGYTKEQFEAEIPDVFMLVHAEDCEHTKATIARIMRKKGSDTFEYRCKKRGGGTIFVQCSASVTDIEGFGENVLLSVITDISREKRAERLMLESSEQLMFLNDTAHDLLAHSDTETGINDVLGKIMKYFGGDRAYVIEIDNAQQVMNNTYEVCGDGVSSEKERLQNVPCDSAKFWLLAFQKNDYISIDDVDALDGSRDDERHILQVQGIKSLVAVPLHNDNELVGFIGVDNPRRQHSHIGHLQAIGVYIAVMLTRRNLNSKIANDNETLIGLMNDTPGGFARMKTNPDGSIVPVYVNNGLCKLLGMTQAEIIENYKHSYFWGVHPDDIGVVHSAINEMLTDGETHSAKYRLRHGDGGYVWVMIFGRMTKNESGEIFFNMYYTDLSEQEKKEMSFRDMLPAALAAMMESAAELSFVKDKELNYVCCSRAFAKMAGLDSEKDIVGKTDYDLFDRELAKKYRSDDFGLLETGTPIIDYIERLPGSRGSIRYSNTSKYPLYDAVGNIIGLYGTGWDVTDATFSSAQLKLLTDNTLCGLATFEITPETIRLTCFSDGLGRFIGYNSEEYREIAGNDPLGIVYKEDLPILQSQIKKILENDTALDCTYRIYANGGGLRWFTLKGTVTERHGSALLVNTVIFDVTAQRASEEALRVGEEELRLAMSQMGKMVCLYDVKTHMLTMPAEYTRKHGFESTVRHLPELAINSTFLDSQSLKLFMEFLNSILHGEKSGSVEIHIKCADGAWCWESGEFVTIFDSDGKPIKAIVSVEDTTLQHEQANESELLRESEHVFKLVAEHSNRTIYRYDIATRTAHADSGSILRSSAPDHDYNVPEAIISKGVVLQESIEDYRQVFKDIHAGTPNGSAKIHMYDNEHIPHWIDLKYSLVYSRDHTPKTAVISFLDITESHEKELAYNRYLQTVGETTASEGALAFFEADITANTIEKHGGVLDFSGFPSYSDRNGIVEHIVSRYIAEEDRDRCRKFFSRAYLTTAFSDGIRVINEDWHVILQNGSTAYYRSESQMVQDPYIGHIKIYTILRDVTEERLAALDLKRKVELDGMTGLYNKTTVEAMISQRLSRKEHTPCALLMLDLDNLKTINDTLGHIQGDRAIRMVGDILSKKFRQTDITGRIGGDEFVVFLENCGDTSWLTGTVSSMLKKLSALRVGSKNELPTKGSVGIAVDLTGDMTYSDLFKRADKALYHVKRNGKNDFAFYTPEMEQMFFVYQGHSAEASDESPLSLTMREADFMLQELRLVFDIVRLVDAKGMTTYSIIDSGELVKGDHQCCAVWNRSSRCSNCISRKALEQKARLSKYEYIDHDIYYITSKYVEVDQQPFVLEVVSNITGQMLESANDDEQFIASISKYNREKSE